MSVRAVSVAVQMWGFLRAYSVQEARKHQQWVLTEARLPVADAVSEEDLFRFKNVGNARIT